MDVKKLNVSAQKTAKEEEDTDPWKVAQKKVEPRGLQRFQALSPLSVRVISR